MQDTRKKQGKAIILTALPVEYQAVRVHLSNCQEKEHRGTLYEQGVFSTKEWTWEVGIAQIGAGNATAAFEIERAINYFQPTIALFAGVAGGIKDVEIGDVVVGTKVYSYESGKAVGQRFLPRPDVGESSYRLIQRAQAVARNQDWIQRIRGSGSAGSMPQVFVGPIASGEKVIASTRSEIYRFLQSTYSDALAVEMEARGFLKATHASEFIQALIIRGISDLLTGKSKADASGTQELAARHASAFAYEILSRLDPTVFALPAHFADKPYDPLSGQHERTAAAHLRSVPLTPINHARTINTIGSVGGRGNIVNQGETIHTNNYYYGVQTSGDQFQALPTPKTGSLEGTHDASLLNFKALVDEMNTILAHQSLLPEELQTAESYPRIDLERLVLFNNMMEKVAYQAANLPTPFLEDVRRLCHRLNITPLI